MQTRQLPCTLIGLVAAVFICGCAGNGPATTGTAASAGQLKVLNRFKVGGDGRWDCVLIDPQSKRLYVPRSDRVMVLDATDGSVIGTVANTPNVHGVAIVSELNRGYTSNGGDGTISIFDLKTLKVLGKAKGGDNPDIIIYDPASRKVICFNGRSHDLAAIDAGADPATSPVGQRLDLGGKPEFAVADGKGNVYVNIEDTSEIVRIDSKAMKVTARWKLAPGEGPSGLAMDVEHRRLFAGCNKLMVIMDADSGKVVGTAPIGDGVDGVEFDPKLGLAFASCGDGTLTVVREETPDKFTVAQTVQTPRGARTMALDPVAHRIYLPTAEFAPTTKPSRPTMLPGTFMIVVVGE